MLTRGLDNAARRQLALRAIVIAAAAAVAGGFLGVKLLAKWHILNAEVLLAGGLVLFLVAMSHLLKQFEPPLAAAAAPSEAPSPFLIAFPGIVTPYGIAAVIALLAASMDAQRTTVVLGMLAAVLVLDLLAMLFSQTILRTAGWLLQILGAVLGVLQVALAIHIMLVSLRELSVLPRPGG